MSAGANAGRRLVERLTNFVTRPAAIYLLALPMAVIEAMLGTESPGAWNRFAWVPFIVYGFLFACDGRFERALGRHWKSALILWYEAEAEGAGNTRIGRRCLCQLTSTRSNLNSPTINL